MPVGSMSAPRATFSATLLGDGRVLVAGGVAGPDGDATVATAEIYDPVRRTFAPTGSMATKRTDQAAVRLADGRVLISGGSCGCDTGAGFNQTVSSAELYDPGTGTFGKTGAMARTRAGHVAILLRDGRVLVVGGANLDDPDATAELYDPATGSFENTGTLVVARHGFTATLLTDGRVLIAGGGGFQDDRFASAELYDPETGVFTSTGSMTVPRDGFTATMLSDGRVLMAGGFSRGTTDGDPKYLVSTDIYEPASGTFTSGPTMTAARSGQGVALLPSRRVLVIGGEQCCLYDADQTHQLSTTEFYDPAIGLFRPTGLEPLTWTRPTLTTLSDGTLLLLAGQDIEDLAPADIASAAIFVETLAN